MAIEIAPFRHRFGEKEVIKAAEWTIRIRDVFNLAYLYLMVHDWLVEEGWAPRDDNFFPETFYVQRDNPTMGKEIWVRWRLTKTPEGAGPAAPRLFSYVMDLNWKVIGMKEVEMAWKGQKVKADRGELEIECFCKLIIDEEKQWQSWPFKQIKGLYTKRIIRQKVLVHRKSIYVDAYRLRDLIMNYLKLETFMPVKEAGEFWLKRSLE